jgi:adenylate cyclase
MRNLLLIIFISLAGFYLKAQNLDSLFILWQDPSQSDSTRTVAYKEYIQTGFLYSNTDSALTLAQHLLRFGETQPYANAVAQAYNLMGVASSLKSDYPKALDYYQRSIKIFEEEGDKRGLAFNLNRIGNIYADQGQYPTALDYYQRCLKNFEEIGFKIGVAGSLGNIGLIYHDQGEYPQALDYHERSLKIFEEMGDKRGMAGSLNNIGLIHEKQGAFPLALDFYQRGLRINEEMGYKSIMATSLNNIGRIYEYQGDFPLALDYYQRSLKIFEELDDKMGIATALGDIGILYQRQGDYPQALKFCNKGLSLSQEIAALLKEKTACKCLYDTYKAMGDGNKALEYLEKINVIDNSLNANETSKKLQQMEFAKQVLQDSLATAQKERLAQEAYNEEISQKTQTRNWSLAGAGVALLLAGGFYSRWRYVRASKAKLQTEKDRSENLLLNILPADIAAELKEKGRADARDFDLVSILFTDFKGFTEQSAKLSAADLVNEINVCFEAFDTIMEKYGIEKIKTIGDAYMAAGGLPIPSDNSVKNTVLAALEMQQFISQRKAANDEARRPAFEMRVGIHTGPVVAGIVGVKKFQYDIWGDTVNTAARIESAGEIGKVNISQATYELLKRDDSTSLSVNTDFVFESRGMIEAKGKGQIEMYFVSRNLSEG